MQKILAAALPLVLLGCAAPPLAPDALALPPSADPTIGTTSRATPDFLGGYGHRDPVEPGSWRDLNEGQAPAPEAE